MITNCKVELTDQERLFIGQRVLGKSGPATRKDVNKLVEMLFDHFLNGEPPDENELHTEMAAGPAVQQTARPTATGATPAKPNNASYMRGLNAVGQAARRMR